MNDLKIPDTVTRVEVIEVGKTRHCVLNKTKVTGSSLQDDGRTLKIFVEKLVGDKK